MKVMHNHKFKEVNKYRHKRALTLTVRKLVRLVLRLLKDDRLYKPLGAEQPPAVLTNRPCFKNVMGSAWIGVAFFDT